MTKCKSLNNTISAVPIKRRKLAPTRRKPVDKSAQNQYVKVGTLRGDPSQVIYGCINASKKVWYGTEARSLLEGVKRVKHNDVVYRSMFQGLSRRKVTSKVLEKAERANMRHFSTGEG
ncbi:hypothetical protein CABS01_16713 [Colletotrichum abscissum]|uniref:Uncharacterized protein n=1 Tax=Colletotrichum abscissum TaxID=1671311 RepID=A0A9P9WZX4_9PEZI|nr:uncharacterized protein CABS01_16713 [Colletotrichum abscissum]KAI3528645.1 hypothetical protein CABS02_15052 [Colletotrichum abscissum]KAK1515395.1 hypothetical protein CABS01_16713 [Colletotrichum abscissum]